MTPERKAYYLARVEQAKDEIPSTGWFINVVALLFAGVVAWAKVGV